MIPLRRRLDPDRGPEPWPEGLSVEVRFPDPATVDVRVRGRSVLVETPPGPERAVLTFLMTDVEGSSRAWEADPDGMRRALKLHDEVIGDGIGRHRGLVLTSHGEGDSVCAVFTLPSEAVGAACQIHQELARLLWPRGLRLRVRIGLHTGEAGGDYRGPAVNRCARVRDHADGDEVVMTAATAELIRDSLPEAARLVHLGEHTLRNMVRPEHIYRLVLDDRWGGRDAGADASERGSSPGTHLQAPPLRGG
jgi:class 3 adenylate cyclase